MVCNWTGPRTSKAEVMVNHKENFLVILCGFWSPCH